MVTIVCKKIKFPKIEAIIFDKDGTLQDSQKFLWELGRKRAQIVDAEIPGIGEPLLAAFGISEDALDPKGLIAVGSRRENEIAAATYIAETGRSWFESLAIATKAFAEAEQYITQRSQSSLIFPGSVEVLKFLFLAGLKLGILSADSTAGVEAFVDRHKLFEYIQLTMGVQGELTKPDPRLFLKACQALEVKPEATIMVGDSQGDMAMAKAAGAAGAIGISWGTPEAAHLETADVAISFLNEIQIFET